VALRVLLADDYPAMLSRVRDLLTPEFDIVATAADGQEALELAERLHPDVAIMDISMPVLNGLDAAARMTHLTPPPHIVFLTSYDDPSFVEAARQVGGRGYILKHQVGRQLVPTLRQIAAGPERT
jgi:two-component system nitrate/nitrite response regulator NarL